MTYFKTFFSAFFFLMVTCSFKAWAELPLPIGSSVNNWLNTLTETQEFLLTGDSIVLIGFLLWVTYIVVFFPKDSPKKL